MRKTLYLFILFYLVKAPTSLDGRPGKGGGVKKQKWALKKNLNKEMYEKKK